MSKENGGPIRLTITRNFENFPRDEGIVKTVSPRSPGFGERVIDQLGSFLTLTSVNKAKFHKSEPGGKAEDFPQKPFQSPEVVPLDPGKDSGWVNPKGDPWRERQRSNPNDYYQPQVSQTFGEIMDDISFGFLAAFLVIKEEFKKIDFVMVLAPLMITLGLLVIFFLVFSIFGGRF